MLKIKNKIILIIFILNSLEPNDQNILMFMLGFILLILQKPLELITYGFSVFIFLIGVLLLILNNKQAFYLCVSISSSI